jgi:2-phosphoglycerate kinase
MGLIRSGNTDLTPMSDDRDLTEYLWPIVREMVKTAIENKQNMIVEGCYIPLDWENDFSEEYLGEIKCYVLVMTEDYIRNHFKDIKRYENVIENRITDDISMEELISDNKKVFREALKHNQECIVIDSKYEIKV